MTPESAQEPAPAGTRATERDSSWAAFARGLLDELTAVVRERLRLLTLEGQQFMVAGVRMVMLGVIGAIFVLTAWFALVAAILLGLIQLGVPWVVGLGAGVLINLAGAYVAWVLMRRLLALMSFSATLRRLHVARAAAPGSGTAAPPTASLAEAPTVVPARDARTTADTPVRSTP